MSVSLKFEPRDLWVGVFWKWYRSDPERTIVGAAWMLEVYLCVVPMLPLHFMFWRNRTAEQSIARLEKKQFGEPK